MILSLYLTNHVLLLRKLFIGEMPMTISWRWAGARETPTDFLIPYWYSAETGSEAISKSGSDVTDH